MRSSTRPPAEWKHKGEDAAPRRRQRPAPGEVTEPWPMLWIGRPSDHVKDTLVYEWDEFLNSLGHGNRNKGSARSMGSVAVTYIKGVEMGNMLADKFDRYSHSRAKALDLQRKVAAGIRGFMQNSEYDAIQQSTERIATQRAMLKQWVQDEEGGGEHLVLPGSGHLTLEEEAQLENCRFAESRLAVSGISLFGRNKLGLDLSKNDQLWQERSGLLGHLRSEGFNTNRVDKEWRPHAVVFDFHDHISSRSQVIQFSEPDVPSEIVLLRPEIGPDLEVA